MRPRPGVGRRRPHHRGRALGRETRAELLRAARVEFTRRGYHGATVRVIAAHAHVDPAMINYWFGGKVELFAAAMRSPQPGAPCASPLGEDSPELCSRLIHANLARWDTGDADSFLALLRSVPGYPPAIDMFREHVAHTVFGPITHALRVDQPEMRSALCTAQLAGIAFLRYFVRAETLASTDPSILSAAIAPTLHSYLTDPLPTSGAASPFAAPT